MLNNPYLSRIDLWRLSDELSVVDASFLTLLADPGDFELTRPHEPSHSQIRQIGGFGEYEFERVELEYQEPGINPSQFRAVFKALRNAILSNKLRAKITNLGRKPGYAHFGDQFVQLEPEEDETSRNYEFAVTRGVPTVFSNADPITSFSDEPADRKLYIIKEPDWNLTTVDVDDLREWFKGKGVSAPFFFPDGVAEGFRDPNHPRYVAKLATAVAAWEKVERKTKGKSEKQTLIEWITSNGINYGLQNGDGVVTHHMAEEVAKIANWNPSGGAIPTIMQAEAPSPELEEVVQNFNKVGGSYDELEAIFAPNEPEDDSDMPF